MKQMKFSTIITLEGVKKIHLVLVCAWCPKSDYQRLQKDEEYTHGICDTHREKLTKELYSRRHANMSV